MKLTKGQIDKLWGEDGPYSQVNLIFQTRILDDSVSRIFVIVEADINPFTYEFVKENRHEFEDDQKIMQLLDSADFRGQEFGYVVCAFEEEYINEAVVGRAKKHLGYTKNTLIKMHKFVMEFIKGLNFESYKIN